MKPTSATTLKSKFARSVVLGLPLVLMFALASPAAGTPPTVTVVGSVEMVSLRGNLTDMTVNAKGETTTSPARGEVKWDFPELNSYIHMDVVCAVGNGSDAVVVGRVNDSDWFDPSFGGAMPGAHWAIHIQDNGQPATSGPDIAEWDWDSGPLSCTSPPPYVGFGTMVRGNIAIRGTD